MSTADISPDARPAVAPVPVPKDPELRRLANCISFLAVDAVERAKSGHPGMPMGMADVATVLYRDFMKFDAADPYWIDRDRFLLSNGHGSMLLYALLYLTGGGRHDARGDQALPPGRQQDAGTSGVQALRRD